MRWVRFFPPLKKKKSQVGTNISHNEHLDKTNELRILFCMFVCLKMTLIKKGLKNRTLFRNKLLFRNTKEDPNTWRDIRI